MADYRDNSNTGDDLDSITLRELEPMNSNPYVRISLDSLDGSGPSSDKGDQRRRQREAERRAEAERQKKAKKRKQQEVRQRASEPSLHVILEKPPEEEYYDDYDYDGSPSYSMPIPNQDIRDDRDRYSQNPYNRDSYDRREGIGSRGGYDRGNDDRYSRSHGSAELEQFASKFPSIPSNLMYGVDEPEPSAPASVVLPGGGWGSQPAQPGFGQGGSYAAPQSGRSDSYGFEGYPSQSISMRNDSVPEPSISNNPHMGGAGGYGKQADSGAEFIKRPWSESAFKEHTATTTSVPSAPASIAATAAAASAAGAALNNPRNNAPKSPSINIPSMSMAPSPSVPAAPQGQPRVESRPFIPSPADPYVSSRGMGSWKRNAVEATRRDMTNNPRANAQTGTVNIKLAPTSGSADTGNLSISRDSLNKMGVGVTAPPARQTTIQTYGTPLIDDKSLNESAIFDESPVSIADGMKSADKKRKRRRGIIIAVVAIVIVAAAAVALLMYNGTLKLDSIIPNMSQQQSSSQGSSTSSQASSGSAMSSSSASSRSSSDADQSGSVIYEYTATSSDGVAYTVNDTVTFNSEGKCQTTHMVLGFPNEEACSQFLEDLQRDYGSAYSLDSQDGANATVTIDISSLKFDREEYEDALRYSVEDLTVLKK